MMRPMMASRPPRCSSNVLYVLGESLVEPDRYLLAVFENQEMRVFVEHDSQALVVVVGDHGDVVEIAARHEQSGDIDTLALVLRLERIERRIAAEDDDDRGTASRSRARSAPARAFPGTPRT
jgi:hypothetical protein